MRDYSIENKADDDRNSVLSELAYENAVLRRDNKLLQEELDEIKQKQEKDRIIDTLKINPSR